MITHPVRGLKLDLSWPDNIDPYDWRDQPDPDNENEDEEVEEAIENDRDYPTPEYVKDILGFDPDETDEQNEST